MLKKKKYIFLQIQDQVTGCDIEKQIKNDIYKYVNKSINSLFIKNKIEYMDNYTNSKSIDVYSIMTTFVPSKEDIKYLIWIHELYAFSITKEELIFKDYNFEKKEFFNGERKIIVYKFII